MKLYERPGWGSAIVEAQLAILNLPCTLFPAGEIYDDAAALAALKSINPLGQIPTLILDDGTVLTESAAITLYLSELTGSDILVPGPGSTDRPAFLRWLVFIVANIDQHGEQVHVVRPLSRSHFDARVGRRLSARAAFGPIVVGRRDEIASEGDPRDAVVFRLDTAH